MKNEKKYQGNLAKGSPVIKNSIFFASYLTRAEVQHAPQLFERIKLMCENTVETGQFWLTGSQQYSMMKPVRETLAGRIGILELYSLSQREKKGVLFNKPLDFSLEILQERQSLITPNDITEVFEHIWRGGMPQVQTADEEMRQEYYSSYVDTYLMRDFAEVGGVTNSVKFMKLLRTCAALTAEQVNYATLATAADISEPTAKEIDVFVELNGYIHPLEIRKSASPNRKEVKKYELLDKASIPRDNGGIVCMCDKPMPIDNKNAFIPSNLI